MSGSNKTLDFDIGSGSEYIIGGTDTSKDGLSSYDATAILTKQGAGVLTLNSNSSYWQGNLEVQEGTLNINSDFGDFNNTNVTLSDSLLNLGNGANSQLNANSLSMNNATLRLTNEGNLYGSSFSAMTISGDSKIIFGALETSTNENRNAITYDNQGYASTHRISTDNNLAIEVEEYVDLTFKGVNPGDSYGGAIFALGSLQIKGTEGSSNFSVTFDGNSASGAVGSGGAVYSGGDAEFHNAVFTNNSTRYGGAIYTYGNVKFTIDANLGTLTSSGNTAIYSNSSGFIHMEGSGKTLNFDIGSGSEYIIGGTDRSKDGLFAYDSTTLTKQGAGVLTLNSNSSYWSGNLEVQAGTLNINDTFGNYNNTDVTLSDSLLNLGNGANSRLNAKSLSMDNATLRLTNQGNLGEMMGVINFSDMTISGDSKIIFGALETSTNENRNTFTYDNYGIASTHRISTYNNLVIELEEYVDLTIKDVNYGSHYSEDSGNYGGAIYAFGTLQIKGAEGSSNFSATFDGNRAGNSGGAVYSFGDAEFHNAVFTNNTAWRGGAIYTYGNVKFTIDANLGTLTSSGNTATNNNSGFIYIYGSDRTLNFDIGSGSEYIIGGTDTGKDGLYAGTSSILTKQGAGVLTLNSNSSNWSGYLEVQAGTLNINDTFGTSTSTSTIKSGAKLSGIGTLYGSTTVKEGGILAPGNSPGTLTFNGSLVLEGGAILDIEDGDKIAILGNLTVSENALENKIIINLNGFTSSVIEDYLFADSVTFTSLTEDVNDYFSFSNIDFAGTVSVVDSALYINGIFIPEPAEYALLFGVLALALAVWKRKKQ